ncbi:MAG: hypothetical protein OEO23_10045 [Gemmatimonadota bacterium]|nr:hypothetical protein [Gemmatimonadota bacterium]
MINMKSLKTVAVAAVLCMGAACVDLDVTNPNEPERSRALANAGDVESLISGQFRTYWNLAQGSGDGDGAPGAAMDALAEAESSNSANDGTQDQGDLPPKAIPNEVGYRWGTWVRNPWLLQNRGLAAIREGLLAIQELDLQIQEGERLQAFAKFMQGLYHGAIALQYDQGFVIDETVADVGALSLLPYDQVMDAALGYLTQARSIAESSTFTLPDGWLGPGTHSSDDLVRLTHSYQARFLAQVARDPAERAAVNWTQVLGHVSDGITEDFGVELDGPGGIWGSPYKGRSSPNSSAHLAFLGPADQSGAYITWENTDFRDRQPFEIDTDDQRVTDGTPQGPGTLAVWRPFFINQPERGTYYLSNYSLNWYFDIGDTGFGFAPEVSVQEMNFLAAEAHIRLGSAAAALPIINDSRAAAGLPAASVDGVAGARCVPRAIGPLRKASGLTEGECGDLMTALIWEKRMAVFALTAGSIYYDARGFGVLRTGKAIHVPIPMEDLQLLGIPMYSFGGGGTGSAP